MVRNDRLLSPFARPSGPTRIGRSAAKLEEQHASHVRLAAGVDCGAAGTRHAVRASKSLPVDRCVTGRPHRFTGECVGRPHRFMPRAVRPGRVVARCSRARPDWRQVSPRQKDGAATVMVGRRRRHVAPPCLRPYCSSLFGQWQARRVGGGIPETGRSRPLTTCNLETSKAWVTGTSPVMTQRVSPGVRQRGQVARADTGSCRRAAGTPARNPSVRDYDPTVATAPGAEPISARLRPAVVTAPARPHPVRARPCAEPTPARERPRRGNLRPPGNYSCMCASRNQSALSRPRETSVKISAVSASPASAAWSMLARTLLAALP